MATSVATLRYGTYAFTPIPQVGTRNDWEPLGENKLGPANRRKVVTLKGYFTGVNLYDVQTKVALLDAALKKEEQTLYFSDGTGVRINAPARVLSFEMATEWGQYQADYTITLSYIPLDDVHTALAVVSYGTFVFSDLSTNINKPQPAIGRDVKIERQSPDATRESQRVTISLVGFFEEGSISANLAKLAALNTALQTDGQTLTYGDLTQTVKVESWSHSPDTLSRRIGYVIHFMYTEGFSTGNIIKLSSSRRVTRVTQRYAAHLVPFTNYATVQLLGKGAQKIQATGYCIGKTLAYAQAAAQAEIASMFPVVATPAELVGLPTDNPLGVTYAGIEDPGSQITEKPKEFRVDWSIEKFYAAPALSGGLYGSGV